MTKNSYPGYALALVAGAAFAIWVGLPPGLLLLLLVCPLMMFFMMRGMHSGPDHPVDAPLPETATRRGRPSPPDGSHERLDQP